MPMRRMVFARHWVVRRHPGVVEQQVQRLKNSACAESPAQ